MSSSPSSPLVEVSFSLGGLERGTVSRSLSSAKMHDPNLIVSDCTNESFLYSGRHDHGELATLKEGGYYASMIGALQDVKEECNALLTDEMEKHKEDGNAKKKQRVNEADAYA